MSRLGEFSRVTVGASVHLLEVLVRDEYARQQICRVRFGPVDRQSRPPVVRHPFQPLEHIEPRKKPRQRLGQANQRHHHRGDEYRYVPGETGLEVGLQLLWAITKKPTQHKAASGPKWY